VGSICLATGARWSEAVNLKPQNIRNGLISYSDTKSGKNRALPIPKNLEEVLKNEISESTGKNYLPTPLKHSETL
jgi:integrase